jgi:hypothetical protein
VDELVHARGMGPNIHQKDAEDHVKRTKQMLAKVGDADSSVDNAAKVEQPGALPMAYDGAHPKESAMTPGEVRADIEKHVRLTLGALLRHSYRQRSSSNEARSSSERRAERVFAGLGSVAARGQGRGPERASVEDASIFHFPRAMAHKKTLSWLTRRYIEPFRRHILLSALLYLLILSYLIYPRSVLLLPPFSCGALEFEHVAR